MKITQHMRAGDFQPCHQMPSTAGYGSCMHVGGDDCAHRVNVGKHAIAFLGGVSVKLGSKVKVGEERVVDFVHDRCVVCVYSCVKPFQVGME